MVLGLLEWSKHRAFVQAVSARIVARLAFFCRDCASYEDFQFGILLCNNFRDAIGADNIKSGFRKNDGMNFGNFSSRARDEISEKVGDRAGGHRSRAVTEPTLIDREIIHGGIG